MRRAIAIAVVLLFVIVGPVSAAVSNDTVAGATAVSVGDTVTEDTALADTTDPAETALNAFCGAPAVEHGVWFTIDGTDSIVAFDAADSDYDAGVMLFAGDPTADGLLDCRPNRIADFLASGTTYNVLVFGFDTSAATGGNMVLHVTPPIEAPEVTLTVAPRGSVDKSGTAHLTGTASCTSSDGSGVLLEVFGSVRQRVGRIFISGSFNTLIDAPCDGSTIHWDTFVVADNGLFAGGKGATVAIATGCTDFCTDAFVEATVQLRKNNK